MCPELPHCLLCAQEPAANVQLYSLCDMASTTVEGLASAMQLQLSQLAQYAGGIILPRGLYRALDKADRGEPQALHLCTVGNRWFSTPWLSQVASFEDRPVTYVCM